MGSQVRYEDDWRKERDGLKTEKPRFVDLRGGVFLSSGQSFL